MTVYRKSPHCKGGWFWVKDGLLQQAKKWFTKTWEQFFHKIHPVDGEEYMKTLRIAHTSDWHLGCMLYGQKRYEESAAFLDWLATTLEQENIDVLLVAGDIFDTTTPSNKAQELYYRFLCTLVKGRVRHVVITAGNHDSPSFLLAPKDLLRVLHIHVIGGVSTCVDDEILLLRDSEGNPELIVCAVPYLRDRDIRTSEAGESFDEKEQKLREGIVAHYAKVAQRAEQIREDQSIPIIAMGHLFAAGGKTVEGDGVRDLYVGKLAHIDASCFPETFSYVALGHLHVPQDVGGNPLIRYSGSPLPIGFGEAHQEKSICVLEACGRNIKRSLLPVPQWKALESVQGDLDTISKKIDLLREQNSTAWLEVVYTGSQIVPDLHERIQALLYGSSMTLLRSKNARLIERYLRSAKADERLEELTVQEVFLRCLDEHDIDEADRPLLLATYQQVLTELAEKDAKNA